MGEDSITKVRPRILESVRVLDFTQVLAGPYCTRLLVDLGAEVIKVEPPPRRLELSRIDKKALWWLSNCGKKSLCLDLTKPEAVRIIHELVKKTDVVIENFRPGVMNKLGIGYDHLKEINPKIIMCSLSTYGKDSPNSHLPGGALVPHAFSGYMWMQGKVANPDGPPMNCAFAIGDMGAAIYALSAICGALYFRERTGVGQYIDISLVDSLYSLMGDRVQGMLLEKPGEPGMSGGPSFVYKGKDGYLTVSGLTLDQQARFLKVIGRGDLKVEDYFGLRQEELNETITEWVQSFDSVHEAVAKLNEADVICSPILTLREASENPHFVAHNMTQEVDDPEYGKVKVINSPFHFSHTESGLRGSYPKLGEHNRELIESLLGYTAEDIDRLQESGVMFTDTD
ncbi:MAG: CoA transferase [Dehalococcoidales bacterium]|nr:CoA transferase [Dehalococcoidales bacterium]